MGIMMIVTGRLGKPERPSFFIPKGRTYSPLPEGQRWYPSRWSGRALFPKHPPDASPEGADNAAVFQTVVIACAAGRGPLPRLPLCSNPLSPSGTSCHPPAKTCHWQLCRSYGRCSPAPSIFFCRAKRNKTAPYWGRKEVNDYGNLSSGS